jgi:Membrane protein involved in the export of O-antigen and teichoic acid
MKRCQYIPNSPKNAKCPKVLTLYRRENTLQSVTTDAASDAPEKPVNQPPSTAGMTTKVVKGSLWTLVGQVLPLMVSLATTPFTIRLLGAEGYGVLILVGLIPTYLGFADFGMSMASTKFGSEAYAEGDPEKEGRIVRTAALIALCTSVPIAALLMLFAGQIIGLFNVPPELSADAVFALRLASITFVINFLCGIFNTPQLARLRMDLNTFIGASSRILGLLATPLVLYLGYGITGAITVLLAASLINLLGHLIVSRRLLPHLFGTTIDSANAGRIVKFGGAMVGAGIASVFLVNAEKGILSGLVSVKALAYYSVAFTLASMATMLASAMIQSLVPAFSQLATPGRENELSQLFSRGVTLNIVLLIPAIVFLVVIAQDFFSVWAGIEFGAESTLPFYFLLAGLLVNIPAFIPYSVLLALGKADMIAKLYWLELLPYLLLVTVLTLRFGILGAAAAWGIRMILDGFLFFWLAKRAVHVNTKMFDGRILSLFGCLLIFVPVIVMTVLNFSVIWLLSIFSVVSGLYILFVWRKVLRNDERSWLGERLYGTLGSA